MANWLDDLMERLKPSLAALDQDAISPLSNGELHYLAGYIVCADDNGWDSSDDERIRRFEVIVKTAAPFISAIEALHHDEAEAMHLYLDVQAKLRFALVTATRFAALRPQRSRGRKPKVNALRVAESALFAFEMITGLDATITVAAITEKAGGAYLNLVETSFQLLLIKASSEHYAKKAIRNERGRRDRDPAKD